MEGIFNEFAYLLLMTTVVAYTPFLRRAFVPQEPSSQAPSPLKKNAHGRFVLFDVMRGIAIMAVIIIHVVFLFPWERFNIPQTALNAIDASMRFALPIFYITSGMLLKPPEKGWRGYAKFMYDKVITIIPAYVLVTGVLALLEGITLREFGINIVTGSGSVPFYFVIILFQLYILYPFIEEISKKRWFVYSTFVFSLLFQFMTPLWYVSDIVGEGAYAHGIPTAFRFIFFFVWGIYMREQFLTGIVKKEWLPWVAIIALCVFVYSFVPGAYYNMRPFYGVAVTMLFYLFFTSYQVYVWFETMLAHVGSMSLWIFLTHFPFMTYLLPFVWDHVAFSGYTMFFFGVIVSLATSILFGYVCAILYNNSVGLLFLPRSQNNKHTYRT